MEDIIQVYSRLKVNSHDIIMMDKKEHKEYIKDGLARNLADYILENMENLPVELQIIDSTFEFLTEYRMSMTLISRQELRRLMEIKKDYFEIINSKEYLKYAINSLRGKEEIIDLSYDIQKETFTNENATVKSCIDKYIIHYQEQTGRSPKEIMLNTKLYNDLCKELDFHNEYKGVKIKIKR